MRTLLLVTLALLLPTPAFSDCGSIPFISKAQVFEPNQRAIIAWNGIEEILLLSTDLSASQPTKVLEIIPLPSEQLTSPAFFIAAVPSR